jgi:hypothetical protein
MAPGQWVLPETTAPPFGKENRTWPIHRTTGGLFPIGKRSFFFAENLKTVSHKLTAKSRRF